MQAMLDKGIATRRGVMTSHNEKAYSNNSAQLPITDLMSNSSIMLPLYVVMNEADHDFVITNFLKLLQQ